MMPIPPPADPRFARFGKAMWEYITKQGGDFCEEEISEDILPLAQAAGLCCRVEYDPETHGEGIEADPGDEIWWWGDFDWMNAGHLAPPPRHTERLMDTFTLSPEPETSANQKAGGGCPAASCSAIPEWAAAEIRETWNAAREAGGELQAFRIIERMVDRLGYGRTENNPPLLPNA